jgi:hypothetical protein
MNGAVPAGRAAGEVRTGSAVFENFRCRETAEPGTLFADLACAALDETRGRLN